jgi:hypothetical protein
MGPPNGPPANTVPSGYTFYANYTVVVTNTALSCQSTSVIPVYQNHMVPWQNPTVIATDPGTFCNSNSKLYFTTEPYVTNGSPQFGYTWLGPANQPTAMGYDAWVGQNYPVISAGVYTLNIWLPWVGCAKTTTLNVADGRPLFGLHGSAPTSPTSCDGSIIIQASQTGNYTLSSTQGSVSGLNISNLCYGWVKVCLSETQNGCVRCDSLLMNETTSVKELNPENDFLMYPNPSHGNIIVKDALGEITAVRLLDNTGREISKARLTGEGDYLFSSLPIGIYLVEIKSKRAIIRKKAIIH